MSRKKIYTKVMAVKDAARANIGLVKSTCLIPDAKTKAARGGQKHKKGLADLMEQE